MNEIYVIATEEQVGYEVDSTKPVYVTTILYHRGFWENEMDASVECERMNAKLIPEDDSAYNEKTYFVLSIDKAKSVF